jgi:hypothetical protein
MRIGAQSKPYASNPWGRSGALSRQPASFINFWRIRKDLGAMQAKETRSVCLSTFQPAHERVIVVASASV